MDELDLTEELKLFYPEIRQMMIPRYIFSYTVDKKIYENTSVLIVTAFSDKTPKGKRIALKCVPKDYFNEDLQTLFDGVSHPNILPIYDIFGFPEDNPRFYCICMPFIDTDLQSYFHGVCHRSLSEMDVCQIMEELFKAVFYIHSLGICHMDLKPSNILIQKIKSRLKPFLIDFDYAYQIPNSSFVSVAPRGTYLYAAPETLRSTELKFLSEATINNSVDIWSLGVIMTELLIGKNPFQFSTTTESLYSINCGISESDYRIVNLSPNAKNLISRMLCTNPYNRITAEEALNHKWFTVDLQNYRRKNPQVMNDFVEDKEPNEIKNEDAT